MCTELHPTPLALSSISTLLNFPLLKSKFYRMREWCNNEISNFSIELKGFTISVLKVLIQEFVTGFLELCGVGRIWEFSLILNLETRKNMRPHRDVFKHFPIIFEEL